jgi:CxxC motif-containing protein (DUF1111 family)
MWQRTFGTERCPRNIGRPGTALERDGGYDFGVSGAPPAGRRRSIAAIVITAAIVAGCGNGSYGRLQGGVIAAGGDGSVVGVGPGAFSQPAANLTPDELARFRVGDAFFTPSWQEAPGTALERDGLGPTYVAAACAACHPADGVGDAPGTSGTEGPPILRFRDAADAAVAPDAYGPQIQQLAVAGVEAEASTRVTWEEVTGTYADGTPYTLRRPAVDVRDWAFGEPSARVSGPVIGPRLIGLGLLEAIPADEILARADPFDADGDGISGSASIVDSPTLGTGSLGRFGRKATQATVADQTSLAYWQDLGVTSPMHPAENCPTLQTACSSAASGGTPEISAERFADVVFYSQTLAVPVRTSAADRSVVAGEQIFTELGCASCHVPTWTTGDHAVDALEGQTIHPYTDLLLHDMGPELSDGRSDGAAGPREWRTTALWGLGLTRSVNPAAGFLHDGRAATIEEAVLWHGGEADRSRAGFVALSAGDRALVLAFLRSL